MWQKIDEARKAVAALVVPGLLVIAGGLLSGSDGGSTVTAYEWLMAAVASLGTSGVVYGVRNGSSVDPHTSTPGPGDRGASSTEVLLAALVVIALIALLILTGVL